MAKKKAAAPAPKYDNSWYKDLVVYQIWCRSFKDGNGDGIGDLWGVMEELDYIQSLGCNAIWFSPIYPSPQADYGYDIADYYNINPEYGDLKLFKKLLDDAHKRGMKVFMDLASNSAKVLLKDPKLEKQIKMAIANNDFLVTSFTVAEKA